MNKRRNIFDGDNERILNVFDSYPFITRTIQAVNYMKVNPISIHSDMKTSNRSKIYQHIGDYYFNLLVLFFSGCEFCYDREEMKTKFSNENYVQIEIMTGIQYNQIAGQLGLFYDNLIMTIVSFINQIGRTDLFPSYTFEGDSSIVEFKVKTTEEFRVSMSLYFRKFDSKFNSRFTYF